MPLPNSHPSMRLKSSRASAAWAVLWIRLIASRRSSTRCDTARLDIMTRWVGCGVGGDTVTGDDAVQTACGEERAHHDHLAFRVRPSAHLTVYTVVTAITFKHFWTASEGTAS
jgi:hypothetical protein